MARGNVADRVESLARWTVPLLRMYALGAPLGVTVTAYWLPHLLMSLVVTVAILGVTQVFRGS